MATIKYEKKEIEKHIKLNQENIEKIMSMGIPISVLGDEVEIEITPNRPDLLSLQGFIRTIRNFFGKEVGLKKYKVYPAEKNFKVKIDPSVSKVRPFTVCSIVKNLKLNDASIKSMIDMQEKLHTTLGRNRKKAAIGIYPLEKITLPIRYEARKPDKIKFIPLESREEMSGLQILQRNPKGREYAHLLENQELFPIFIDSKDKILSLPPIINSHETGKVTEQTKEVFVECSGSDLNTLKRCLNIIVTALADLGGKIYEMELEYKKKNIIKTPDLTPEKMKVSLENVNKLLGLELKEKDLEKLLPRAGYDYKSGKVSIPAWRTDILHEVDIIEDIAVAYGYDNLEPEIPKVATIGQESHESKTETKIAEILIGLGLLEISSYHLVKQEEIKKSKVSNPIELENSKTDYKFLRPNLIIPALRIFSENKDNEYPQKIFEIGTVYSIDKRSGETGVLENNNLIIASSPGNFTEIKQILDYLVKMLGTSYSLKEKPSSEFIEGRSGAVIINGKEVGSIGEIHPETLNNWNIKMPIALLEISLEEIFK